MHHRLERIQAELRASAQLWEVLSRAELLVLDT